MRNPTAPLCRQREWPQGGCNGYYGYIVLVKNIDISKGDFSARLKALRESAGLTRSEFAMRAGVATRTILDLEMNRRQRIQEKTLLLIAKTLAVSRGELLASESGAIKESLPNTVSGSSRMHRASLIAGVALIAIVSILFLTRIYALAHTRPFSDENRIGASAPLLGSIWTEVHDSSILVFEVPPWNGRATVAYGLDNGVDDGGWLFVRNLGSGELLWEQGPNIEELENVFGEDFAWTGDYRCVKVLFADLDGDGEEELITHLRHRKWFPSVISFFKRDGARLGAYYHRGHLYNIHTSDFDQDGKKELLIGGTSNARQYRGASLVMLDDTLGIGAFADSVANPGSTIPERALVRVVFPQFADRFLERLPSKPSRINAFDIDVSRDQEGKPIITANVGTLNFFVIVTLDSHLLPMDVMQPDEIDTQTRTWPTALREEFTGSYLQDWLSQCFYLRRAGES